MSPKDAIDDIESRAAAEDPAERGVQAASSTVAQGHGDGFLASLPPADQRRLLSAGRRVDFAPGAFLFEQGDSHDGVVLILSGRVRSYYTSSRGRVITLAYWPAGHLVGAPQILGGGEHMWTSVAVEPSAGLKIQGPAMKTLVRSMPDLAVALIEELVYKSKCYTALLQLMATESKTVRLAQLLLTLMGPEDAPAGRRAAGRSFTQEELAGMIGATRQAVSQALDRFDKERLIARDGLAIQVIDAERMRRAYG